MTIYMFTSTHWDREWYQTFQGFRMRLVEMMDDMLEVLENDLDYGVFHMDGQTVVLEDYLEIQPHNRDRVRRLIESGKLKVGPWYSMPDEFLLSGESLIKNLQRGFKVARSFGAEPLKYGYVCDIFGHMSQTAQIFGEMGLTGALLGRGTNEHTTPAHFLWESMDGTKLPTFKLRDSNGYGAFRGDVLGGYCEQWNQGTWLNDEELKEKLKAHIDYELSRTDIPVVLLMDGLDHWAIDHETPRYMRLIRELYPEADVKHVCVEEMVEELQQFLGKMPVKRGELKEPAKIKASYVHLITHTLSSRYPIKKENDLLQTVLERWVQPLYALGEITKPIGFLDTANTYLMKNHPHDSICGCSIDQVHRDMMCRFAQAQSICSNLLDNWKFDNKGKDAEGEMTVRVFNPLPYGERRVIELEIPFPLDYPTYAEPFGYENICKFHIYDEKGNELPYGIRDIQRNAIFYEKWRAGRKVNLYKVMIEADLLPMGETALTIRPAEEPASRQLSRLPHGEKWADNGLVRIDIRDDGSVCLTDHATGKQYDRLLGVIDDGEIGDGWFHANPACDRIVTNTVSRVEICENNALCVSFRITQELQLPEEIVNYKRVDNTVTVNVVHTVTLAVGERRVHVVTDIDNKAKDHRMRLVLPTGLPGGVYSANQPFAFVERTTGIDESTASWRECEVLEKQTAGIVCKRGENSGLAFVSAYGVHECGVTDDGDMLITLFRSTRNTVGTAGEPDGQLIEPLCYTYDLLPLDDDVTTADLQRRQDFLQAGVQMLYGKKESKGSLLAVEGKNICFSTANPEKEGFTLRVYNMSAAEDTAVVTLPKGSAYAASVNLDGAVKEELAISGGKVSLKLGAWKFGTILVK